MSEVLGWFMGSAVLFFSRTSRNKKQPKEQLSQQETPNSVCVRYKSRKSTDLDALRSREVTVTKVEIVVMVAVVSE